MPSPTQIIPTGNILRPKIETYINDNTEVQQTYTLGGGTTTALLCVFSSPKGRDNQLITITDGIGEFMNEYGLGPYSIYGQPLLNAYSAASVAGSAQAMIHCLRVTAADAEYSNATLVAKYKADTTAGTMSIQYVIKPSDAGLTDLINLDSCCTVPVDPDENGYKAVKLMTFAYLGKGEYGKNVRFRINTDTTTDKNNNFKNYVLNVYRNETVLEQLEGFNVTFVEDSIVSGASLYAQDVIDAVDTGSSVIDLAVFTEGFAELYNAYLTAVPDTKFTVNDFDPLLGIDKYTRTAIPGLTIEPTSSVVPAAGETAVNIADPVGIALLGGSDGAIAAGAADRETALNTLYLNAFSGKIDPNIKSKNRYPTTFILDANYDVPTKLAIASLSVQRGDCMAMLDVGLDNFTVASLGTYYDTNFANMITDRLLTIEPYAMKIRDPYSQKTISVSSTYWLASEYLQHIYNWNGKHRPLAGNRFGIISGHIPNSIYPVLDDDLDADLMDDYTDKRMNYARYNPNQVVVRSMQNTSQPKQTALTEQNNMLVVLDVKRDCERLCARFEYDFSEVADIARFNTAVSSIADKYAAAQVRSITAAFGKNEYESQNNILHLYVEMVCKDLVKTTIIEIDINRSDA